MTESRHGSVQNMLPPNQKTDSRENIPLLQMDGQNVNDIGPLAYPVTSSAKPSSKTVVPKFVFSEEDDSAVDETDGGANGVSSAKADSKYSPPPTTPKIVITRAPTKIFRTERVDDDSVQESNA